MHREGVDVGAVREVLEGTAAAGRFVREARLARNLSQVQLAERAMVSRDTIKRLESGDPGVSLGTFVSVLWCMDIDSVLRSALAPEADRVGQANRLRAGRERARRPSRDELERKMDF